MVDSSGEAYACRHWLCVRATHNRATLYSAPCKYSYALAVHDMHDLIESGTPISYGAYAMVCEPMQPCDTCATHL